MFGTCFDLESAVVVTTRCPIDVPLPLLAIDHDHIAEADVHDPAAQQRQKQEITPVCFTQQLTTPLSSLIETDKPPLSVVNLSQNVRSSLSR